MPSMHAWVKRSFASRNERFIRLLSRWVHSASTIIPKRSSKASALVPGLVCCSCQAVHMPSSRSVLSFSIVGSFNIVLLLRFSGSSCDRERSRGRACERRGCSPLLRLFHHPACVLLPNARTDRRPRPDDARTLVPPAHC